MPIYVICGSMGNKSKLAMVWPELPLSSHRKLHCPPHRPYAAIFFVFVLKIPWGTQPKNSQKPTRLWSSQATFSTFCHFV